MVHRAVGALLLVAWTVGAFALWMTGLPLLGLWTPPFAGFIRSYARVGMAHGLPLGAWIVSVGVVGGVAVLGGALWYGWGPDRWPR